MAVSLKLVVIQILAGTQSGRFVVTNVFFQNVDHDVMIYVALIIPQSTFHYSDNLS